MTALLIAKHLGSRVAVIDTERGSAAKYADDVASFDTCNLESHDPRQYIAAIDSAAKAGYDVLIVDSLSHAWMGRDGALEQVDKAAKRNHGNSFAAWRDVSPLHQRLVDSIISWPGHVIVTLRSKMEYILEKDERTGRTSPKKIGLAPVTKEGVEFEVDVFGELDQEHTLVITKSRCAALSDAVIEKPGKQLAEALLAWLTDGEPPAEWQPTFANPRAAKNAEALRLWITTFIREYDSQPESEKKRTGAELRVAAKDLGVSDDDLKSWFESARNAARM